jgi:hypothetical protein
MSERCLRTVLVNNETPVDRDARRPRPGPCLAAGHRLADISRYGLRLKSIQIGDVTIITTQTPQPI